MFDPSTVTAPLREELARLRADGPTRAVAELVELVEQCQSVVNRATALQTLAMAHLAAIEDVELEDGTVVEQHRGLGHQRLDAPALVSEPLGLSDAAACRRMMVAVEVATRAPVVLEAMASGRLDGYRAGVVCEELREAPPEVCREVGARIAGSLGSEPPALLRRRVRRALGAVDADLVRVRAARARAARSLRRWPGDEPGVDTWMGSFPVEQARSGWAVVDGLARQYVRDGRASGVDEARADALMDLIHSRATGTFAIQLAVPAEQLASAQTGQPLEASVPGDDSDGALVTVAGLGVSGETQVRRTWLASLSHGKSAVGPRVVACHAGTGALLPMDDRTDAVRPATDAVRRATDDPSAYRPPRALVELVKARDGRCRFPGCSVSAVFCDLDHVRPWPTGPTAADNLMCLCRRHHRIKQSVRWRVRIEPDAAATWTDPAGRLRTTAALDFLQLEHDDGRGRASCGRAAVDQRQRFAKPAVQPQSQALRPGKPARADETGVLWSAWEDDLTHELARAARRRRHRGPPQYALDRRLVLDRRVVEGHRGARGGGSWAAFKGPPPF